MYELSNDILSVSIQAKGAELQSIFNKDSKLEYMWSGDPAYWGKKSPVLFPIVGGLKNNKYHYKGVDYTLPRHGFAREKVFTVTDQSTNRITFTLWDDAESIEVYPFHFRFSVTYELSENELKVIYQVENTDTETLYFSVGAHPAFSVPMVKETEFTDFHLFFSDNETTEKWPLSDEGLILNSPITFLEDSNTLPLTKELFYRDALVCKTLKSNSISIVSNKTQHGLQVTFYGFPYMGIWSAKNANFVCIEPWCGIADSIDSSGDITQKEGIHSLMANKQFTRSWSVQVF